MQYFTESPPRGSKQPASLQLESPLGSPSVTSDIAEANSDRLRPRGRVLWRGSGGGEKTISMGGNADAGPWGGRLRVRHLSAPFQRGGKPRGHDHRCDRARRFAGALSPVPPQTARLVRPA